MGNQFQLSSIDVDAIVMLATPDGIDELYNNYEHYVKGFAHNYPIIIVLPDVHSNTYHFEDSPYHNTIILHIYQIYSEIQSQLLHTALAEKHILSPLLWIHNPQFIHYVENAYTPFILYHVTEASFPSDDHKNKSLIKVIACADLIMCDSEHLKNDIITITPKSLNLFVNDSKQLSQDNQIVILLDKLNYPSNAFVLSKRKKRLTILFLYDAKSIFTNTVKEHLESFGLYSQHQIYYCSSTPELHEKISLDLTLFDVVMVHYSLRQCLDEGDCVLTPSIGASLQRYSGYKVLFIQDEYDHTNLAKERIKYLGINLVYTCVPPAFIESIYPKAEFPHTEFISNLTGYVPERLKHYQIIPLEQRQTWIGYRGRNLPYWYGDLGQEKMHIGIKMHELATARGLPIDIAWTEEARIYGDNWYTFLGSLRATLGTESGSNVFDFTGEIRKNVEYHLEKNKCKASYKEIHDRFISKYENLIKMNQISPKIFESIALGTALILFEGDYSNVIKPNKHYIPLKKDFSNIDDVFNKLADLTYLQAITTQAYNDIILQDTYSYKTFVNRVDAHLAQRVIKPISMSLPVYELVNIFSDTPLFGLFTTPLEAKVINKISPHTPELFEQQIQKRVQQLFSIRYQLSEGSPFFQSCIKLNRYAPFLIPLLGMTRRFLRKIRSLLIKMKSIVKKIAGHRKTRHSKGLIVK